MTASSAYSRVSTTRETPALAAPTLPETPALVNIRPKTTHGCRPSSVKIQPKLLARRGRKTANADARHHQVGLGNLPLRVVQSPTTDRSRASSPKPIIRRNDQYAMGMFGL